MTLIVKRIIAGLAIVAATLSAMDAAPAQPYPNRPIRLIAPFPPGGPVDVMARLVAQRLSTTLGQVIVENRPGAGSTIGAKSVAQADPDGYTLLLASSASLAIGPALFNNIGYDPLTSFVPIAMVSSVPYVMVAAIKSPFKNVPEMLAYAKANPGKLNFGVPNGAPPHVLALSFKALTGADIVIVPYKGAATVITDLIGGQIDAGFETTSVMFSHLHEGKVRGLAVVRETRQPELPDVPTMIESGVPKLVGSSWTGIMAPAGTPPEIVNRLRAEIIEGLKSPDMVDKFKKLGAEARFLSLEEFMAFVVAENQRLGDIIRSSGTKAE
jgi:tripartite-type tricarboxylate transporter receptor subunit TctC